MKPTFWPISFCLPQGAFLCKCVCISPALYGDILVAVIVMVMMVMCVCISPALCGDILVAVIVMVMMVMCVSLALLYVVIFWWQ